MLDDKELLKKAASMRLCKRVYNFAGSSFLISAVAVVLFTLIMVILSPNGDVAVLFIDGIFFKGTMYAFGYLGVYQKKSYFSAVVPVIVVVNNFTCDIGSTAIGMIADLGYVLNLFCMGLALLTIYVNKEYHKLEQYEEFPHFSQRYEEQKELSEKSQNIYQERYEEIVKNKSDTMDEI